MIGPCVTLYARLSYTVSRLLFNDGKKQTFNTKFECCSLNISLNAMNCYKIETRVYILDFKIRFLVSFMAAIPVQITLNQVWFLNSENQNYNQNWNFY